ncbi:unnamed protein product [Camellia sinensis]
MIMPRQNRVVEGLILGSCKIRKRGCSSSSSSVLQNYQFKRAILVGKPRGSRSSTLVLSWRTVAAALDSPKYVPSQSGGGRSRPVFARKLAATLWEMNEVPSPRVGDNLEEKKAIKREMRVRERMGVPRSVHSGSLPPHLSDPSHSPVLEVLYALGSATPYKKITGMCLEKALHPGVNDDRIILDKTLTDQVSIWKNIRGLTDKVVLDHDCSGETCTYSQIGDVFVCEKTGQVHVCDDTCREAVLDPTNELLVCTISGHCFDRFLSPAEMEPDTRLLKRLTIDGRYVSVLPNVVPGQRKILFCSFKCNFVKEAKVAQFSGYVSEHSAYLHGEQSLASTIIGMAQDYVGSNNLNLLQPNGQFGTRHQGGKDHASARYIYTQLSPITRFMFPKDDDILLDYLNEDGQSIEPICVDSVVYLVDAHDKKRFAEAKKELDALISDDSLANVPFLILGNKIDIPYAASEDELRYYLGLTGVTTIGEWKKQANVRSHLRT